MELPILKVEPREMSGKGPSSRFRRRGLVPGVCYGRGKTPLGLVLDPAQLKEILRGSRGRNALIRLEGLTEARTVFVQEIQAHPVSREWVHVDFLHVDPNKPLVRPVPVDLQGRPEGVKAGGVLQIVRRTVEIESLPSEIPDKIGLDVSSLLVGQSIHVKDMPLPPGVRVVYDTDYTICAVVAPTEEKKEEEAVPVEGAEGVEAAEGAEGAEAAEGAEGAKPAKAGEGKAAPEAKADGDKKEKAPAREGAKKKG